MTTKNLSVMRKNNNLTVLRGVFIIMVVLHHLNLYEGGGTLGVAFFFMLGGFVLSLGYYDKVCKPDFAFGSYIRKRCGRFFPLHWLCLIAVLPLSLLPILKGSGDMKVFVASLMPNVLLLQSLIPIKSIYFSFNGVSWYLSATMILAILFPFIVKGLEKISERGKLLTLTLILSIYALLVYLLPVEYRHAILYINPIVRAVDFIIGIYLFLLYRLISTRAIVKQASQNERNEVLSVMMMIVAVVVSCIASEDTVLIAAIYWLPLSILLISSMMTAETGGGKIFNLLVWIGEISFPMFLTHQVVIRYVEALGRAIGLYNTMAIVFISIPLIILVSWLCDKYFLRPVSLWLKERTK